MKSPKIINIVGGRRGGHISIWYVTITTHMLEKLPEWVRDVLRYHYAHNNPKHTVIAIKAVDELQAMARFLQLWDCLPKEEI